MTIAFIVIGTAAFTAMAARFAARLQTRRQQIVRPPEGYLP